MQMYEVRDTRYESVFRISYLVAYLAYVVSYNRYTRCTQTKLDVINFMGNIRLISREHLHAEVFQRRMRVITGDKWRRAAVSQKD